MPGVGRVAVATTRGGALVGKVVTLTIALMLLSSRRQCFEVNSGATLKHVTWTRH